MEPEDIADTLFVLGANGITRLFGKEDTAELLSAMADELRESARKGWRSPATSAVTTNSGNLWRLWK
jgi:hypothetical protein